MAKSLINLRAGADDADEVLAHEPMQWPGYWLPRIVAAEMLDVGVRTIDRYIRRDKLTSYKGPFVGAGIWVLVWKADVDRWAEINAPVVARAE